LHGAQQKPAPGQYRRDRTGCVPGLRRSTARIETPVKYDRLEPISNPVPADRQGARRHYGVHPYFTRRPYNVVATYIKHFTKEGDTVLDPFGGSGVTAIEAVLNGRNGIHNDINPLANFVAGGVMSLSAGRLGILVEELKGLELRCRRELAAVESGVDVRTPADFAALANTPLPRNADARTVGELFSPRQLAAIAVIRRHILGVEDSHAREALLLAWSATLPKLTRTFLSADGRAESRGGSSIFSIYRYKTAANPVELPCWKTFEERARNIVEAKREIDQIVAYRRGLGKELGEFQLLDCDVLDLPKVLREPVDYVFTDPH